MLRERQKQLLLELRSKLVGTMHVQPYIVYDDDTIELLLKKQPKTLDELKQIKGFPEKGKRFKGFGLSVCAIFNDKDLKEIDVDQSGSITAIPRKIEF